MGDKNILNSVNEIEKLLSKSENIETIENLNKDYPDKNNELEEALLNYKVENDLKVSKTEIPLMIGNI